MAELPWVKFWVRDYMGSTVHLTNAEHPLRLEAEHASYSGFIAPISVDGDWIRTASWQQNPPVEFSVDLLHSDEPGAAIMLDFVGSGVSWIGGKGPDHGMASVYLDGQFQERIDQYAEHREFQTRSFTRTGLSYGHHTLTIRVDGAKTKQSSGARIDVDAFDVAR